MRKKACVFAIVLLSFWSVLAGGCKGKDENESGTEISVTNSYLACAVWDLCGDGTKVFCLAPPGVCPGHFDISPGQIGRLSRSRVLLLFDFQKQMEETLARIKERGLKMGIVTEPRGLCVPETYIAICKQVCEILSENQYDEREELEKRSSEIEAETGKLGEEISGKMKDAGLVGAKVLTSHHQAAFAKWLGLDVVARFVGSDAETVSNVSDALEKAEGGGVRFVIANKQEGTALAKSLAERLGVEMVVFSNFPELSYSKGFGDLLRANVEALVEAAGK